MKSKQLCFICFVSEPKMLISIKFIYIVMWKVYLRNGNNAKLFMLKRNTSKFGARRNQTIIQRTSMFDSCWRNLVCAKPNMLHKHCSNENSMPHRPHHHVYLLHLCRAIGRASSTPRDAVAAKAFTAFSIDVLRVCVFSYNYVCCYECLAFLCRM